MQEPDTITTLASTSEGSYKEKGSKFHSYGFPVQSIDDIKKCLEKLKKEHPKARHHCYAYRLGSSEIMEFSQDAGEPSGSAGPPILNVLRSNAVTDALIVVVRYFGGTKLGIPGLIHAYKQASESAVENNRIITRDLTVIYGIKISYEKLDQVYKLVSRVKGKILEQSIDTRSVFRIEIPVRMEQTFTGNLSDEMEIEKF